MVRSSIFPDGTCSLLFLKKNEGVNRYKQKSISIIDKKKIVWLRDAFDVKYGRVKGIATNNTKIALSAAEYLRSYIELKHIKRKKESNITPIESGRILINSMWLILLGYYGLKLMTIIARIAEFSQFH